MKNVLRAENSGFCFGVQRAVEESLRIQREHNKKIYTLGPLIHNNDVVKYLEDNNIFSISMEETKNLKMGDVIVIRSHGVPEDVLLSLENQGLKVINATCPFVTNIQKKVRKYSDEGYDIIILGDEKHPEVVGINGWCDNKALVTKDGNIEDKIPSKVCIVSQTTEKEDNWKNTLKNVSSKTKEVLAFNTICSATEVRQKSAYDLSQNVDVMIVVGGKNSSNTTKLYQISKKNCENTIHIENAKELDNDFINSFKNKKVGITAGASTPEWIIKEVIDIMEGKENVNELDQLSLMNSIDRNIKVGEVVEGEILSISNEGVSVALTGYGRDGFISKSELTVINNADDFINSLNKGDKIKGIVIKRQNDDGNVVLSRLELEKEDIIKELKEIYDSGKSIKLTIKDGKDVGIVGYYKGVRVFIPTSQINTKFTSDTREYVGKELEVRLIDFSMDDNKKVVASRKVILEEIEKAKLEEAWSTITLDAVVDAQVKRFTNFGVFARVNDAVDGLIHISEISWGRVDDPKKLLKKDQIVKAKVIKLDKDNNKLSLSIKALVKEPWEDIEEKYEEGSIILGTVKEVLPFGAFVELEPGVEGLVHISKISFDKVENINEFVNIGEEVKAKIISINKNEKRISLSMKDV